MRKTSIYNYLLDHVCTRGYAPTIRELAEYFGTNVSNIHGYLERMERDGKIRRIGPRAVEFPREQLQPTITKRRGKVATVIEWQGKRYVYDPSTG